MLLLPYWTSNYSVKSREEKTLKESYRKAKGSTERNLLEWSSLSLSLSRVCVNDLHTFLLLFRTRRVGGLWGQFMYQCIRLEERIRTSSHRISPDQKLTWHHQSNFQRIQRSQCKQTVTESCFLFFFFDVFIVLIALIALPFRFPHLPCLQPKSITHPSTNPFRTRPN